MLATGATVGLGSALTGTSGPVIILPILVYNAWPTLTSLGYAQAVQLPIAIMATLGNVAFRGDDLAAGEQPVEWVLGTVIGIVGGIGVMGGASLAHRLRVAVLRSFITRLLCLAGAGLLIKVIVARVT